MTTQSTYSGPAIEAIEAARVAFTIAASYETSEPVVLRADEFNGPHNARVAVDAALAARKAAWDAIPQTRTILVTRHLNAVVDCGRAHLHENVDFRDVFGGLLTVVVTVHATSAPSANPVETTMFSELTGKIQDQNECTDLPACIIQTVFIIDEG